MQFSKLEQLASSTTSLYEGEGTLTEDRARRFFDSLETRIESVDKSVKGEVLKKLLADGGFPATESKALIAAWNKFCSEFDDLKMGVISSLE